MPHALRDRDRADDRRLPGGDADDRRVGADVPAARQHAARQRDRRSGYYGAFTANMHTDFNPANSQTWSTAIINVRAGAQRAGDHGEADARLARRPQRIELPVDRVERQRPVVHRRGRRRRQRPAGAWSRPPPAAARSRRHAERRRRSPTRLQTIKGVQYAVFAAGAGSYQVAYGADIVPPTISAVSVTPGATTATVTWTTNEPADSTVSYGTTPRRSARASATP